LVPLPQIKYVDGYFGPYIDEVEAQITNIEHLPSMPENYKELHRSESSTFIQYTQLTFAGEVIPCILVVESMVIAPYSENQNACCF
jgi:hypothetical protein